MGAGYLTGHSPLSALLPTRVSCAIRCSGRPSDDLPKTQKGDDLGSGQGRVLMAGPLIREACSMVLVVSWWERIVEGCLAVLEGVSGSIVLLQ